MSNTQLKGCLNEILDAGVIAGSQLPDIFWDLDITGKELQVLRYAWSNVIRLHRTVRVAPRGRDGSPRYWRDKEKMAADCRMSCPTFRNSVRSLYKRGLTTTMDGPDDLELILTIDDTAHCIGLNPQFFVELGISFHPEMDRSTREYTIHLMEDICPKLYDKVTMKRIWETTMMLFELEDKASVLDSLQAKDKAAVVGSTQANENTPDDCENDIPKSLIGVYNDDTEENRVVEVWGFQVCPPNCHEVVLPDGFSLAINNTAKRSPIPISREAIVEKRTPNIALTRKERSKRMMEKILQERDRLHVLTRKEQEVMELVHYYEYKCRVVTGKSGWRCLSNNFREHRNWKQFVRLYDMCVENDWDYKIYIDAQFDRVRYWTHKNCKGYPYPNQFFSEGAVKYYHKYLKDYKERHSVDGTAKVKVSKVQSYKADVIDAIIKDCDHFVQFLKIAPKQRRYQGLTREQMKFGYIIDHVASLSQYYWASLPWAVSYLRRFTTPWVVELTTLVSQIQKSQSMVDTINMIVREVENQMGVPPTVLPG